MKYFMILALASSSLVVSAQQPISPQMAQLAGRYQSILNSDEYERSLAVKGILTPQLQAADDELMVQMSSLVGSEISLRSSFAEGDNYLFDTLLVQSDVERDYFLSVFMGTPDQEALELSTRCYAYAFESIKELRFYGWRGPAPSQYCLDVPEGASMDVVNKIYKAFSDGSTAKLKAKLASLQAASAQ